MIKRKSLYHYPKYLFCSSSSPYYLLDCKPTDPFPIVKKKYF